MLCPCCGTQIERSARRCGCGARFVGEPLDEKPVKIKSYGPVMNSIGLLAVVTASALIFTKFLAVGAILVIWSSRRAMRLAKGDPATYGGFAVATATLVVTIIAGSVAAGFTVAYIPRFLENRKIKRDAATMAPMRRMAALLEEYKCAKGVYPIDKFEFEMFAKEAIPTDFWEQHITYTGFGKEYASIGTTSKSVGVKGGAPTVLVAFDNFELRSNGPDGKPDTEDDIIMRDGIFYTHEEIKKMPSVKASAGQ